ncbi:hypothetical protein B566_EDAN004228 [Ephemera danica]|nr:hypothetical protein B566_EDAN004228 [Ephemera danica]
MLRNGTKLLTALQELKVSPNHIIIRWRRKPRWFPVAPSKMYRIPERPKFDPEEHDEMLRLFNNYRTTMRAIRTTLYEEVLRANMAAKSAGAGSGVEEEEFSRCMAINEEWNRASAAIREQRLAEQAKSRAERALRGLAVHEALQAEKAAIVEQMVEAEKELGGTYITAERLDAAIEEAIANPVDYNFCIDLEGNITYGRDTKKPPIATLKL